MVDISQGEAQPHFQRTAAEFSDGLCIFPRSRARASLGANLPSSLVAQELPSQEDGSANRLR